jgi:hypothetical protein
LKIQTYQVLVFDRMFASATPQSVSKKLASRGVTNARKAFAKSEEEEVNDFLSQKALEKFESQNGREPTEAEQQEIRKELDSAFPLVQRGEDSTEEPAETMIFDKICSSFEQMQGRTPKVKDLESILGQLKQISSKVHSQDKEKAAVKEFLAEKAAGRFEAEHGRPPSSPEKKEIALKLDEDINFDAEEQQENGEPAEEEEDAAEKLIFDRLCSTFQRAEKRAPNEEELENILEKLKSTVTEIKKVSPLKEKEQILEQPVSTPKPMFSMGSLTGLQATLEAEKDDATPVPEETAAGSSSGTAEDLGVDDSMVSKSKGKNIANLTMLLLLFRPHRSLKR